MPRYAIVPPHLLKHAAEHHSDPQARTNAAHTLEIDQTERLRRTTAPPPPPEKRTLHNAAHRGRLPGAVIWTEGEPQCTDQVARTVQDWLGVTFDFYKTVFGRDSVDGKGLPLVASIHYRADYDNAFWNGHQMVYGDGDGKLFSNFTAALDITGHELTHGLTQYCGGLTYSGQSGALNESISDVFGSMAKQWHLGQPAEKADWLIGEGMFAPGVHGVALRSMKAPGTAYDDPNLGKDPQPATMAGFVKTTDDNGGVHTNSGIPNHAFYLASVAAGGNAWETTGLVWYRVLTSSRLKRSCDFTTFARLTIEEATAGAGQRIAAAITDAWRQVGVLSAS